METTTPHGVQVQPELLAEAEAVLYPGETLQEFAESSVRTAVARRRFQADFVGRGLHGRDEARRSGEYFDADFVVDGLQARFDAARARMATIAEALRLLWCSDSLCI